MCARLPARNKGVSLTPSLQLLHPGTKHNVASQKNTLQDVQSAA
jgi:hypothetical protein